MRMESQKNRGTSSAMVLLAVAALLGALVLYEVAEFFMTTANAALAVARATGATMAAPNDIEAQLAQAKSVAEALKKNNLFTPPAPKRNPVTEVSGILGSEALINGKWYKAGDKVADAEIVAVGPTKVKVSWNGQETEFTPMAAEGKGGPPGSAPSPPGRNGPPGPPRAVAEGRGRGRSGGPAAVSPEEQAKFREQFRNASPEERQKLREAMQQRFEASRR